MMISEAVVKRAAQQLIEMSDYAARHQQLLHTLVETKAWMHAFSFTMYLQELEVLHRQPVEMLAVLLRKFRHQHLLRLLLREFVGLATTEETMRSWSDVADALIVTTLKCCHNWCISLHGEPLDSRRRSVRLYPVALGKLGGQELNFSSDIDLFFIYDETGQTAGPAVITNEEYFIKVIKKFIYLFQNSSNDGFVFRVDLRLRPFGASSALAMSVAATEVYYQEQGRDWERYAMVKARFIGDDADFLLKRFITPFVYRKYVDFSVIESLRSMKMLIERELILNPLLDDIKRGMGGIREIEFIIQCFQLIRGGRMKRLQIPCAMRALEVLGSEKLLRWSFVLKEAYLFYRKLENALQTFADRQTHTLPQEDRVSAYVLLMLKYDSHAQFIKKIKQYQRIVRHLFCRMLGEKKEADGEQQVLASHLLTQIWKGHIETTMAVNALKNQGISHAEQCYYLIHVFRHSPKCRRLSQVVRLRLDRLMIRFLEALAASNPTTSALSSMFQLFDVIVNRSVYLALLTENDRALHTIMYWFQKSPLIANWVVSNPFLLDTLIFRDERWQPLTRAELKVVLQQHLSNSIDKEIQAELLREFKLIYWLQIACTELSERCTSIDASRFLSNLAEVIVLAVVDLASAALSDKYPEVSLIRSQFSLLAYGKLGSKEMSYHSDLDLVFLHDVLPVEEKLVIRLTQKVLYMLTTRSRAGILYPTDTRLRPSGSSGLLVSSASAFVEYQSVHAWTWEHQALLKARVLLGSKILKQQFFDLKKIIFSRILDKWETFDEIHAMRIKMKQHHVCEEPHAMKYHPGGLLDLEFLVQFLVLTTPHAVWRRVTHIGRQLLHLQALGVFQGEQYHDLKKAYEAFHHVLHQEALNSVVRCSVEAIHYDSVQAIYAMKTPVKS